MSKISGREIRSDNRQKRKAGINQKADELIMSTLKSLLSCPVNELRYKDELGELFVLIDQKFSLMAHRSQARNHVIRHVEAGNRDGRWSLPLPNPTIKLRRHVQSRTLIRHRYSAEAVKISSALLSAARNPVLFSNLNSEERLHLVLLSAIFFGGLNNSNAVRGLSRFLRAGGRPEKLLIDGQVQHFVCFTMTSDSIANAYVDGKPELWHRWYCDPVSMCMMSGFDKCAKERPVGQGVGNILRNINKLLKKLDVPAWSITSLDEMVMSGAAVSEQIDNVDMSVALVGVACGKTLTTSIPPEAWLVAMQAQYFVKDTYNIGCSTLKIGRERKRQEFISRKNISNELYLLSSVVKLTGKNLKKRTAAQALKGLMALDINEWSVAGEALRDWYVHHLTERSNSLSTVSRYHSEIAKYWFDGSANNDYSDFDSNDWEDFYESILENFTKPLNRSYRAGRLQDLHDFGAKHFGFSPAIVDAAGSGNKPAKYVHASYISHELYLSVRKALQRTVNLNRDEKLNIELMVVLAYRLGLRISEICKLRLCDVDVSEECWIFVRENIYGDNKSSSSLRKIPARVLMSGSEWNMFKAYLEKRRLYSESSKELLFHPGLDKYSPWDKRFVSDVVGAILKDISGLSDLVFHSFRHTALSNLQLVIEREWEVAAGFMCIQPDQLKAIYAAIVGSDNENLRRYWALACFAGHNSPSITFQCYFHFSDLLIGLKLSKANHSLTKDQLVSFAGLSRNTITRKMKKFSEDINKISSDIAMPVSNVGSNLVNNEIQPTLNERAKYYSLSTAAISHDMVYKILEEYQNGVSEAVLSHKYGLGEEQLSRWIGNGRLLADIKTRKGKPRLISKERASTPRSNAAILPSRLTSKSEMEDAKYVIELLRKEFVSDKKSYLALIDFYLRHVNTSNSGINITKPRALLRFVRRLDTANIIPLSRWAVTINCPALAELTDGWDEVQRLPVKSISINPIAATLTTSYLRLTHPDEDQLISGPNNFRKFSARTLRYVFHMIAIMQFDESFF